MPTAQQSVHIVAATVGFLSFFLLWSTVIWGTLLRVGWGLTRVRHQTLYGIHQTLTLVGLTLGVVHQAAAVPRRAAERLAGRVSGRQVMVNVDPSRCVRFGFCEHEAPDIFQLRGDGRLTYRPTVPAGQVEQVVQAARVCPARAIMLSRSA